MSNLIKFFKFIISAHFFVHARSCRYDITDSVDFITGAANKGKKIGWMILVHPTLSVLPIIYFFLIIFG